jgi:mRNA interferase MazF
MQRGEVWWAELPNPAGRRPVLLLSLNTAYNVRNAITVGVVTSTIRDIPVEVPLDIKDGMPRNCVVNLDDIITIPKTRLVARLTTLSPEKMTDVDRAIIFALDLKVQR